MEESNKLIPSLSIWLLHFSVNKIILVVESLIVESPVKNCSLKDFMTLFTSQNQMNNDILGNTQSFHLDSSFFCQQNSPCIEIFNRGREADDCSLYLCPSLVFHQESDLCHCGSSQGK